MLLVNLGFVLAYSTRQHVSIDARMIRFSARHWEASLTDENPESSSLPKGARNISAALDIWKMENDLILNPHGCPNGLETMSENLMLKPWF
jgi:hypothetical protein